MGLEGRILGNRYELIEQIGSGGMATVYKAKCHILNRYVAVKILRDEFTTDDEFIKRFNTEAQAVASLTHPNIVSVYDVGHEENLYYIVMELIKGRTLKEIIVSEGVLAWKWCVNVAIQIASALETAHRNNIIHRDIKPHNIIITEDGIAKVTDFGIAKAVSNSTITAFGTTMGSVHYFSPEHAKGGITDAKSDIYSLGVVLYEMLTGKVPFDADTPVSIALKHIQEDPVEPIAINSSIPIAVDKIIMKAMKKNPNMRYQNATEMLRDLSMSLKTPNVNFVDANSSINYETQRFTPIYTSESQTEDNSKRNSNINNKKNQNKFSKFIKQHKALSIIFGFILLFVMAFGGTNLFIKLTTVEDVLIPNVVGLTKEEAQKIVEESKLKFEITEETYDTEIEEGKVISQTPEYKVNYKIKEKNTISVVVSLGQKIVTVPKVTGMTEEEATETLEKEELKVQVVEEASKKVEAGIVISQDVTANSEVGAGSTVTITVSTGVEMSTVPDLTGKTEEEAKKAIEDAGLTLATTKTSEDSSKTDGIVISQTLDAGEEVEKGTKITITVNKVTATKTVNVIVDLKSITGGYTEDEEDQENETSKTVTVIIKYNDQTETRTKVDKNKTAYSDITISGKDGQTQKVSIEVKDETGTIYSTSNSVTFGTDESVKF
jgi:serine/threonine-protein kinase